jgi:hypothetical protein
MPQQLAGHANKRGPIRVIAQAGARFSGHGTRENAKFHKRELAEVLQSAPRRGP